jgi:hypothetical protein
MRSQQPPSWTTHSSSLYRNERYITGFADPIPRQYTSHHRTSQINTGWYVILRGHISTETQPSWVPKQRTVGLFIHHAPHESTSSQNYVMLHELCRTIREGQLSYVEITPAVLLSFRCERNIKDVLRDVSTLAPILSTFFSVSPGLRMFTYCVVLNVFLEILSFDNFLFRVWKMSIRKLASELLPHFLLDV